MSRQVTAATLATAAVMAELPTNVVDAIAAQTQALLFEKDDSIIRQLDDNSGLYIIISGAVRANMVARSGRELTYEVLPMGEMFGEMSAIDNQHHSTSINAEEPSLLARIEPANVRKLILQHPDFAMMILQKLVRLSRRLITRLYEYQAYNVRGRVICEILRLHDSHPSTSVAITDRDMASRVGTTRENVTRIHAQLRKTGLIQRDKGKLSVLNQRLLDAELIDCEFS